MGAELVTICLAAFAILFMLPVFIQMTHALITQWGQDDRSGRWTRIVLVTWCFVLEWSGAVSVYVWWHVHEYGDQPDNQLVLSMITRGFHAVAAFVSFVLFMIRWNQRQKAVARANRQADREEAEMRRSNSEDDKRVAARTTVAPNLDDGS